MSADRIFSLLKEKKELLLQIERVTNIMKDAPAEELMDLFTERGELLERAQSLGTEIARYAEKNEEYKAALSSEASPNALSAEAKEIFEASLGVKAVANRVTREDEAVLDHIKSERNKLLDKIKELNSSGAAVAGSYRRSVQTGVIPKSIAKSKSL